MPHRFPLLPSPPPSPFTAHAHWQHGQRTTIAPTVMMTGPAPIPLPPKSDPRTIIPGCLMRWLWPAKQDKPREIYLVWELRGDVWRRVGSIEHDEQSGVYAPTYRTMIRLPTDPWFERVEEWTLSDRDKEVMERGWEDRVYWWNGPGYYQEVDAHFPTPTTEEDVARAGRKRFEEERWWDGEREVREWKSTYVTITPMHVMGKLQSVYDMLFDRSPALSSSPCPPPKPLEPKSQPCSSPTSTKSGAAETKESTDVSGLRPVSPPSSSSGST